jgi:S-adenosylmethionine:tRNA ribosyltransferase-isomerase
MTLTSEYDYELPEDLIAQYPSPNREESRLLVLERVSGQIWHKKFPDLISFLNPGDVIVLNNTRVIPARLRGINVRSGGAIEVLIYEQNCINDWWSMLKPGRRARPGTQIQFYDKAGHKTPIYATVVEVNDEGHRRLQFHNTKNILNDLYNLGEPPLPPYIRRQADLVFDAERYQTIFAKIPGSVAAPTAGLHFSDSILKALAEKGVKIAYVTLHVGIGTFAPVKTEEIENHKMHEEWFEVPEDAAKIINDAKSNGKKVLCVGTTTIRTLETVASRNAGNIIPMKGKTNLFIYPPYEFKVADLLLTNFHLPRSTLLMLVCAFASPGKLNGKELILKAYKEAINYRYRFYSYGDAMLII